MKPQRDYRDYLADMIEASDRVTSFIHGMTLDGFLSDEKTQYAVVRGLEIIGEAAKKLPSDFTEQHPHIPWREIVGMRDKLVHDYFGVNAQVVWKTAVEDVPPIAASLRTLLG